MNQICLAVIRLHSSYISEGPSQVIWKPDAAIMSLISHYTALLVGRSRDRFPVVSLGIFSVVPTTEPCALRSTQPLKVSTRDLSWGKGGQCVWLMTYHPCSAETSRKPGALTYPEPLGPPRPVAGDLYFTLH